MSFLSTWIMQIIIFILIATIIEMLLPNNSLKRYVNIVTGLLLLLIFVKPLLLIFSLDVSSSITSIERGLDNNANQTIYQDNAFDSQKKEIQAEQDAYILSEISQQLIQSGNLALADVSTLQIFLVEFVFIDNSVQDIEDLQMVTVHLTEEVVSKGMTSIEPIVIDPAQPQRVEETNQHLEVKSVIAATWDIKEEMLTLVVEGGTS